MMVLGSGESDERPSAESLCNDIVEAVAEREGVDATELDEPLYSVIDVEALRFLFRDGPGHVTFRYLGYQVTVDSLGNVEVCTEQSD